MRAEIKELNFQGWVCAKCGEPLVSRPVKLDYMGMSFDVDLPCCPNCGFTFIPPDLAEGKMLEAEKILEDK
jgi:predicted RNA-binding Zn-ribbon protein involved in translation (DUF1610 family)